MSKILFDIIIPHYGTKHLTQYCLDCLEAVRKYSYEYRLIFIDNASPEFDKIENELNKHNHTLIRNSSNLGFIKAVNEGLAITSAPFIVLLNNDTLVAEDWLQKLMRPLNQGAVISGPLTDTKDSWQGNVAEANGWLMLTQGRMLAFFCTMFRREVFENSKVGYLDEDFGPGFGDDDHFCWKAEKAGYRLALARDLVIKHHHRSTFKEIYGEDNILAMQQSALALFRKKQVMRQTI